MAFQVADRILQSPREFWAAFEGWRRANTVDKGGSSLTDEELETLEDMKRRFPDKK